MNKFLIVTFIFFLFGCSGLTNDCGEIYSKYIKDAEYFLFNKCVCTTDEIFV